MQRFYSVKVSSFIIAGFLQLLRSESCENTWVLKEIGNDTLIGLLHAALKAHPLLHLSFIRRLSTTLFIHAPVTATIIFSAKLAEVDSDMP